MIKIVAECIGQELSLRPVGRPVGLDTQQQVVAQAAPAGIAVPLVYHAAERGATFVFAFVMYAADQVAYNHVTGPGGTVVVKIIVSVDSVLGSVIFVNGLADGPFLFVGQIERLLSYPSSLLLVSLHEVIKRGNAHLVIGEAEHETQDKELLVERKHAVVDSDVLPAALVMNPDGGVAVKRVHFLSRAAGDEANLYGVHGRDGRLGLVLSCGRAC